MIPTDKMQQGAQVHQSDPSHWVLSKPAHQNWGHRTRPSKANIEHGGFVIVITKFDGAEKNHVADDAVESKFFAQFYQQ